MRGLSTEALGDFVCLHAGPSLHGLHWKGEPGHVEPGGLNLLECRFNVELKKGWRVFAGRMGV